MMGSIHQTHVGFKRRLKTLMFGIWLASLAVLSANAASSQAGGCSQYYARVPASVGPEARSGARRAPLPFTAVDRAHLLQEFKDDGRPILVVTDATFRQKSGVVTVMKVMSDEVSRLSDGKVKLEYLTPDSFKNKIDFKYQNLTVPLIRKKVFDRMFADIMKQENPQAVHIMVEGALGKMARQYCIDNGIPFTTAYHSMFPEFVAASVKDIPKIAAVEATFQTGKLAKLIVKPLGRKAVEATDKAFQKAEKAAERVGAKVSEWKPYRKMATHLEEPVRKLVNDKLVEFHKPSQGILVPTESMAKNMIENGYDASQVRYWSHGVDIRLFNQQAADPELFKGMEGPISIFIGRVAAEKNIEDFLKMKIPGTKVVVGGGPDLDTLQRKYPEVRFLGPQKYENLPKFYASVGDRRLPPEKRGVFVFPSLTDTFGLVQLEANASGVPVVAYKVQGPVDVITSDAAGRLADYSANDADGNVRRLTEAWHEAQKLDGDGARAFAEANAWEKSVVEALYFFKRLPQGQH